MNILVVDDDATVLQVCQGMLRAMNHTTVGANDAVDAVEYLTATLQELDLVILDHGLPGLTGMELLTVLREWNMSIPVILISGARPNADPDESLTYQFLAKPFTMAELARAIEQSQQ